LDKGEKSMDALEKCMEWLSFHPSENGPAVKEQDRREILEYRQKAVREWVDQIPEEEESPGKELKLARKEKENEEEELEVITMSTDVIEETVESTEDEDGLGSDNYILSKFPTQKAIRDSINERSENSICSWLLHHLLGKCWKRSINIPEDSVVESRKAGKTGESQDLAVGVYDGKAQELSSGEVFPPNTSMETSGQNKMRNGEINSEEILRLTSFLQNSPKPTIRMKSIFSLRKERIPPEKQSPPSVFTRVGKQMRGFIANRLGIGSANQNRGSRFNRINPCNHSRVPRVSHHQQQQPVPEPEESLQDTFLQRVLHAFFTAKPS
jgi:hypothetical protein